jgi:hypothetical protein
MTKLELIAALNKIPGDPDVIMWDTAEDDDGNDVDVVCEPSVALDDDGDLCISAGEEYPEGDDDGEEVEEVEEVEDAA